MGDDLQEIIGVLEKLQCMNLENKIAAIEYDG